MKYVLLVLLLFGCSIPQGALVEFRPIEILPMPSKGIIILPAEKTRTVSLTVTCDIWYHDEPSEILAKLECLKKTR